MANQHPLEFLHSRAEEATQEAMRKLATSIANCNASENRLALLQRYRDEYEAKLTAATRIGISATELANFRNFLGRLEQAIGQQNADVAHCRQTVTLAQQQWQAMQRQERSYAVLNERREHRLHAAAERIEQKQNDEYALRLAANPRWT